MLALAPLPPQPRLLFSRTPPLSKQKIKNKIRERREREGERGRARESSKASRLAVTRRVSSYRSARVFRTCCQQGAPGVLLGVFSLHNRLLTCSFVPLGLGVATTVLGHADTRRAQPTDNSRGETQSITALRAQKKKRNKTLGVWKSERPQNEQPLCASAWPGGSLRSRNRLSKARNTTSVGYTESIPTKSCLRCLLPPAHPPTHPHLNSPTQHARRHKNARKDIDSDAGSSPVRSLEQALG